MHSALPFLLPLLAVMNAAAAATPPPPPQLPPQFIQTFTMNNSHGTRLSSGIIYYDWPTKRQRVEHSANSSQCHHFWGTYDNCTEIFTEKGEIWVMFLNGTCCLNSCADGCREPSTWLPRPDYTKLTTFAGYEMMDGYNTTRWNSSMLSWFTVGDDVPVCFANGPASGGPKVWALHYNVDSFKKVASDPALFEVPTQCREKCWATR